MRKLLVVASVISFAYAASAGLFDALVRGLAETGGDAIEESAKNRRGKESNDIDSSYYHKKEYDSRNEPNEPKGDFGVGTKTGETKTITLPGGATMEMIYVAPGSFMMGSPSSEDGRNDDEKQHRVTLTKGFWLGKYEVTQKQWQSVMGDNPSRFKSDNRPVENVSWDDCQMFIARVNNQLNCGARLPTEAEWEYACRAGTTTAYFWGNSLSGDKANCDGNYPCGTTVKGPYRGTTVQVGSYPANAWGFCDMHGNVCEWCNDWYGQYPTGSVTDPLGSASGVYRVLRGGCCYYVACRCRSANRYGCRPGIRDRDGAFRLCCSAGGERGEKQ